MWLRHYLYDVIKFSRRFGLQNVSARNREQTPHTLEILRLTKQGKETYLKSSESHFTDSVYVDTLQNLRNQIYSLTEEYIFFLNEAEAEDFFLKMVVEVTLLT